MVGRRLGRLGNCLVGACLVAAGAVAVGTGPAGATKPPPVYYLSLGDSLAQGVQPNKTGASVETSRGYTDDLYNQYRRQIPGLLPEKIGCPGESTTTMITGGICTYTEGVTESDPLGNQLAQAESFLAHNHVAFVTIDIGANDIDGCVGGGGIDPTCFANGLTAAATNLPVILSGLQAAAPGVPIYAMNYYDPFLFAWVLGPQGQALATASVSLGVEFNNAIDAAYAAAGVPVADVQDAFETTNFTPQPAPTSLPINVQLICGWTWMCTAPPRGPNIHADRAGYSAIATAFETTIGYHPA
ncbi:MAG TPA: SGNH/GDSL hydrolase family protein [Acidimicrobiales bacterium]|nr:SGNH/GDSL hydrolase family protein [Acidimicrobiales bacterium]